MLESVFLDASQEEEIYTLQHYLMDFPPLPDLSDSSRNEVSDMNNAVETGKILLAMIKYIHTCCYHHPFKNLMNA